jgi:hypothetical protein
MLRTSTSMSEYSLAMARLSRETQRLVGDVKAALSKPGSKLSTLSRQSSMLKAGFSFNVGFRAGFKDPRDIKDALYNEMLTLFASCRKHCDMRMICMRLSLSISIVEDESLRHALCQIFQEALDTLVAQHPEAYTNFHFLAFANTMHKSKEGLYHFPKPRRLCSCFG